MREADRRWKCKQIRAGMCRDCRVKKKMKGCSRCVECMVRHRVAERTRKGCKAWHPGGLGRPPRQG